MMTQGQTNFNKSLREIPLNCGTRHDRDGNAATNIRAEGIRMLKVDGTSISADGGEVRPKGGRKSILRHSLVKSETACSAGTGGSS